MNFDADKINEGGIDLLLISNLINISARNSEPFEIIKSYFGTGTKGMMECSKELIDMGYSSHAQL